MLEILEARAETVRENDALNGDARHSPLAEWSYLRWANLKESPPEHFESPLVLIPVALVKKKGVRDTYWLSAKRAESATSPRRTISASGTSSIMQPRKFALARISAWTNSPSD
jgi:hypothetical protein